MFIVKNIQILLFSWIFDGCDVMNYNGDERNLAAATIHSIPGTRINRDSRFLVLEEDGYGRVLFSVYLSYSCLSMVIDNQLEYNPPAVALIIFQKAENNCVYFYPEENYRIKLLTSHLTLSKEAVLEHFSEECINELKTANDWDEPIDSGCPPTKVPYFDGKNNSVPDSAQKTVKEKIGMTICCDLIRKDKTGKGVYFVEKSISVGSETVGYEWYYVMFDSNWELVNGDDGVHKIDSIDTMAIELKQYLAKNDWQEITQ